MKRDDEARLPRHLRSTTGVLARDEMVLDGT